MTRTAFNLKRSARAALILAGACALLASTQVAFALGGVRDTIATPAPGVAAYSTTLERCAPSAVPAERSATFTAQMTATSTTQRMEMRFEFQQRMRGASEFHTVLAPGLGVWHSSEAGVQIYKYVKQVTNLAAPAAYRAIVHFRWLGDRGRVIKRGESHTSRCVQPRLANEVTPTSPTPPVLSF